MRLGPRWWSALSVALLVLVAAGERPSEAQLANTLVVGLVAEPVALDPAQVTDLNSNRVGRRVVETLVAFADESHPDRPRASPSPGPSRRTGSATPSSCARASPSTTAPRSTPQAVKFSIERQINPEHPASKLGKYPFAAYFFGNVKAVEVMDDADRRASS